VGLGIGGSIRDPALLGAPIIGTLSGSHFGTGNSWSVMLRPRPHSAADLYTAELRVSASELEPRRAPDETFDRSTADLLVGRRLTSASARSAIYLLAGAQVERADLVGAAGMFMLGPSAVHRKFAGPALGVRRVATRFDTLTWLLPAGAIADVAHGTEGSIVTAVGRDLLNHRPASHVDAWVGRINRLPAGRALIVTDLWASGYLGDARMTASTVRAAVTGTGRNGSTTWVGRLGGERLIDPDPDVRALMSVDPLVRALPIGAGLAAGAAVASFEVRRPVGLQTRTRQLEAALFGGATARWDAAHSEDIRPGHSLFAVPRDSSEPGERLGAGILGIGLRVVPRRTPGATVRLDLGYPVLRTPGVARRPFVAFSVMPWLTSGRQRGSRTPTF
jgi:hypothetical protein